MGFNDFFKFPLSVLVEGKNHCSSRFYTRFGVFAGLPIGHYHPFKTKLLAQHPDKVGIFRHTHAVYKVVRRHDHIGFRLYGKLKGFEINFAQNGFVHFRRSIVSAVFKIICTVVFYRCADMLFLYAAHILFSHNAR